MNFNMLVRSTSLSQFFFSHYHNFFFFFIILLNSNSKISNVTTKKVQIFYFTLTDGIITKLIFLISQTNQDIGEIVVKT